MSLVKQCLNVWPPVSEGRECLRVRMCDLGGFWFMKEDRFGCVRVRVTNLGV